MSPAILAAALELSRIHGIAYAAFFLLDRDIAFEVIAELLWNARPRCELYPAEDGDYVGVPAIELALPQAC
jgi:hypothetical protein